MNLIFTPARLLGRRSLCLFTRFNTTTSSKRTIYAMVTKKRKAPVAEMVTEAVVETTVVKRGARSKAGAAVVPDVEAAVETNERAKRARKAVNYSEDEPRELTPATTTVKKGRKKATEVDEEPAQPKTKPRGKAAVKKEEEPILPEEEDAQAPAPKKRGARAKAQPVDEYAMEGSEEEPEEPKPKKRAPRKKAVENGDNLEGTEPVVTKRKRVSKKVKTDGAVEETTVTEETTLVHGEAPASPEKKKRKSRKKEKILPTLQEELAAIDRDMADLDLAWMEDDEKTEGDEEVPEIVDSDINPLPYTGRLGYACLNTILRAQDPPVFCSRTCRLATLNTVEVGAKVHLETLGLQNARDLIRLIEWNERHGIKFLRISSEMFPFASHMEQGYNLDFAADVLGEAGKLAAKYGHRLTMHPGQFTQLATPREEVFKASVRELEYHTQIMDLLKLPEQMDKDAVLILHMGGVYGDKETTIARFKENWAKIPWEKKKRVVLENDDVSYSVHDLLPVCKELNIPMVLDWHHHNIVHHEDLRAGTKDILPLLPEIAETWTKRGITQKMHYSEPEVGARGFSRRKHSMLVRKLPPCLGNVDLMIEAKGKEKAVFGIMRRYKLGDLGIEGDGGEGVSVPPPIAGEPTIGPAANANGEANGVVEKDMEE